MWIESDLFSLEEILTFALCKNMDLPFLHALCIGSAYGFNRCFIHCHGIVVEPNQWVWGYLMAHCLPGKSPKMQFSGKEKNLFFNSKFLPEISG